MLPRDATIIRYMHALTCDEVEIICMKMKVVYTLIIYIFNGNNAEEVCVKVFQNHL